VVVGEGGAGGGFGLDLELGFDSVIFPVSLEFMELTVL
jgi:hypothetical protein